MRQWMLAMALATPLLASATEPPAVAPQGQATRAWLDLQRSGNAALGAPRPMPGEVADKVYQRYLDSFSRPVPEAFNRQEFVTGGGGR